MIYEVKRSIFMHKKVNNNRGIGEKIKVARFARNIVKSQLLD